MKKTLLTTIVLVVIAVIGYFMYMTRPVATPSQDIQSVSETASTTSGSIYRISQASSVAEFNIHEMLYGAPKLVVGTTTQIAGDIIVSSKGIEIGTMKLDVRTLKTDSSKRDGAINRLILKTDAAGNEYVTFVPKSTDLKGPIALGKQVSFNVSGDLTIAGVTKPVTFAVKATVAGDKVTGTASTTINRPDFKIVIPSLSFLADVSDQISISVNLVANKVTN